MEEVLYGCRKPVSGLAGEGSSINWFLSSV